MSDSSAPGKRSDLFYLSIFYALSYFLKTFNFLVSFLLLIGVRSVHQVASSYIMQGCRKIHCNTIAWFFDVPIVLILFSWSNTNNCNNSNTISIYCNFSLNRIDAKKNFTKTLNSSTRHPVIYSNH